MQNIDTIQKIAKKTGEHPMHVGMFFLNFGGKLKCETEDCYVIAYNEYKKKAPKPFVKWVGGKRQLAKQFRDKKLYPPNGFDFENATYFEPFVGGGAMFFDLMPKKAVLSDMNSELVRTYNIIKNDVDSLIKNLKIYQKKHNKDFYLKIRAQNVNRLSDLSIATRFIYLNRTCFNGLYRVNKSGQFNVPYGKYNNPLICDEINLCRVNESLKDVKILHQDYKNVLKKAKKGDFIYFDPPYYPVNRTSNFTSYVKESFLEKEQTELRDTFLELHKRGCFVMLSNSDTPFINELYSGINKNIKINKVFAGRAINSKGSGRGKVKEVVIINY
jgi:DNA adenine methylase